MSYNIRILTKAKLEIKKAKEWYENKSLGLGDIFAAEIEKAIDSLSSSKLDHKLVFSTHRRMLLHKFPYTIYYKRDETIRKVSVVAVLHNKQSFDTLKNRI